MKTSQKLIAGIGGLVLAVAATFSVAAIANPAVPVEDSPAKIVQEQPKTVDLEPEVTPEPTQEPVAPAPAPEPAPAPAPVAPPPPPPAPKPAPAPSGAASGTPLPMEDKGGGYMDYADPTTFCASKGGTTINGVPSCA